MSEEQKLRKSLTDLRDILGDKFCDSKLAALDFLESKQFKNIAPNMSEEEVSLLLKTF